MLDVTTALVQVPDSEMIGSCPKGAITLHTDEDGNIGIFCGGDMVGSIDVARQEDGTFYVLNFCIVDEMQNLGIGSMVLKYYMRRADMVGAPMFLEVDKGSPAERLYIRHGFVLDTKQSLDDPTFNCYSRPVSSS